MNKIFYLLSIVPFILGIIFYFISKIGKKHLEKKQKNCNILKEATIVEVKREDFDSFRPTDSFITYYPIYQYEKDNKVIKRIGNVGNKKEKYPIGKTVQIYINPNNDNDIYVPSENAENIFNIFKITGTILITVSLCIFILLQFLK